MAARTELFRILVGDIHLQGGKWAFPLQGEGDSAFTFCPSPCGWAPT